VELYTNSPNAFMAQTGTNLNGRILLVLLERYVADFGFVINGGIFLGMSGVTHLHYPCLHGIDRNNFTLYNISSVSKTLNCGLLD
jgi:hypothetical protein